jgi:hypothetical protein
MAATRNKTKRFVLTVATTLTAVDQRRFEALLQQRGVTRSALLRDLVQQALGVNAGAETPDVEVVTVNS